MDSNDPPERSHPPVSDDVADLVGKLRKVQWGADEVAHSLPSGRFHSGHVAEVADLMESVAQQMRVYLVRRLGDAVVDDAVGDDAGMPTGDDQP